MPDDPTPFGPPDDLTEAVEGRHTDELVDLLRLFRAVIDLWGQHAALIESEIANRSPVGQHATTEGDAFIVRKGSKKVTYDDALLWPAIVARALDERIMDAETGEYEREADAVARVLRSCLGKQPNFVVAGLVAIGIDPDDYRTKEGRRTSVQT